jgi:hypothetical protein
MKNDTKQIEKFADTMIEVGTKLKEFIKEDFLNKPESELTDEDKNKYYQFIGIYVSSIQKLNEMRLEL